MALVTCRSYSSDRNSNELDAIIMSSSKDAVERLPYALITSMLVSDYIYDKYCFVSRSLRYHHRNDVDQQKYILILINIHMRRILLCFFTVK